MSNTKLFNPIATARRIEKSYRDYIATTIHFDDRGLQRQLEELLDGYGYLSKGPYIEAAPPYEADLTPRELIEEGVLCRSMLKLGNGEKEKFDPDRPLYTHQVRAVRKGAEGRNFAVVTGTGSGKTECFLLPILNDILNEFEHDGFSPGIRAMIMYPMNALANDQLKRLRELLAGTEITFGRYTGDTREAQGKAEELWREENPGQNRLPNEIISREEIRKNPPNILLTNYSMLEYLLLRPEDAPLFGSAFGSKWRHVAIDEAHVYSGALGTEIAFLLRRLKARIASEVGSMPDLHCYATSATIGSEKDMPLVAKFAEDLFGEHFSQHGDIDVITSAKNDPIADLRETWGRLPLSSWIKLRELLILNGVTDSASIREVIKDSVPPSMLLEFGEENSALLGLGRILLGESSTEVLIRRMSSGLMSLSSLKEIEELGIPGLLGDSDGIDVLSAMVDVLSIAQRSDGVPVLSCRYHSFLRAPEGLYINLSTKNLSTHKHLEEDCGYVNGLVPIYEVSVCRHCGQAYVLGRQENGVGGKPAWLNPRHEGTDADDDFLPRDYYRLLHEEETPDEGEEVRWLCPICGSLHDQVEGGGHVFSHPTADRIPIGLGHASEDDAKCGHCGYRSKVAIQPMRVSPEAAGSVVCYDLVRDIPPFESSSHEPWLDGDESSRLDDDFEAFDDFDDFAYDEDADERAAGSVICFSDRRQDAAFFAPAMERTYGNITRRQIIREAVEAKSNGEKGCSPEAVEAWIEDVAQQRYPEFMSEANVGDQAIAWVIDELTAEDSRNSLGGLGVVRVLPSPLMDQLRAANVRNVIAKRITKLHTLKGLSWVTIDDFVLLFTVCVETLRERNAIIVPEGGVYKYRADADARRTRAVGVKVTRFDRVDKSDVSFVGTSTGPENKRSDFIRKYASNVYGVELSRDDSTKLLDNIYQFMYSLFKNKRLWKLSPIGDTPLTRFALNRNMWTFYPHKDNDVVYICDSCGCMSCMDTGGVCTTNRCNGIMVATTYADAYQKDRYYKDVYGEEALPIRIEEHTAQISSKRAREIQSDFTKGKVNVLSCTTTFELGVDVGDLRAIFMRNVPPTTANYTQRAGRVGRRAGMPGYAVTFARLRPHDVKFFESPETMIGGETRVPLCYLDNVQIAQRHVYAVALSEFFRLEENAGSMKMYHDLMDLSQENPVRYEQLKVFLDGRPDAIAKQLSIVAKGLGVVSKRLIVDWAWVDELLSGQDGDKMGRLARAHLVKHLDYQRVLDAIVAAGNDSNKLSMLHRYKGTLEKEQTISVLADEGVLPKYGFPTDLVDLHLPVSGDRNNEGRLKLQRGMRQAIREYAPGAEIVAGKALWKSFAIKRLKGQSLIARSYGTCPQCKAFAWPIDVKEDEYKCPVCGTVFELHSRMLVPSFGFEGKQLKKGVGLRRPRSRGYANVYFSQHWPSDVDKRKVTFESGTISGRFAGNGELCLVNTAKTGGRGGFQVCSYCYAAATMSEDIEHWDFCRKSVDVPFIEHYDSLGASFTSDVLELAFSFKESFVADSEEWESVMWALFAAASRILEVPETELGGTLYSDEKGRQSIMLYDDVPGGAGHTKQLYEDIEGLVKTAYDIVTQCDCGEETCCYGCIANYYNQGRQSKLSRGAAKRILGALLTGIEANGEGNDARPNSFTERALRADFSVDLSGEGFATACGYALRLCEGDDEREFVERLAVLGAGRNLECPQVEVTFSDDEGNEADAILAWKDAGVVLLGASSLAEFADAGFGREAIGWQTFVMMDATPEDLLNAVERRPYGNYDSRRGSA